MKVGKLPPSSIRIAVKANLLKIRLKKHGSLTTFALDERQRKSDIGVHSAITALIGVAGSRHRIGLRILKRRIYPAKAADPAMSGRAGDVEQRSQYGDSCDDQGRLDIACGQRLRGDIQS